MNCSNVHVRGPDLFRRGRHRAADLQPSAGAQRADLCAMYEQMASICEAINADRSIKALIMTGAGDKAFASGTC